MACKNCQIKHEEPKPYKFPDKRISSRMKYIVSEIVKSKNPDTKIINGK